MLLSFVRCLILITRIAHSLWEEVVRAGLVQLGEAEIKVELNCSQQLHEGQLKKKNQQTNHQKTKNNRANFSAGAVGQQGPTGTNLCLRGSAWTSWKIYLLERYRSTEVSGGNLQEISVLGGFWNLAKQSCGWPDVMLAKVLLLERS